MPMGWLVVVEENQNLKYGHHNYNCSYRSICGRTAAAARTEVSPSQP
jgi:hypothetical protein